MARDWRRSSKVLEPVAAHSTAPDYLTGRTERGGSTTTNMMSSSIRAKIIN
jgi:hypothetical protein